MTRALVWASVALAFGLESAAVALNGVPLDQPQVLMAALGALLTVIVGALLVTRVPSNIVAWLLWMGGLLTATTLGTSGLATYGLVTNHGVWFGAIWLAWISDWSGFAPFVILAGFLPLVFPTGQLPSHPWRIVAALGVASVTLTTLERVFGPGTPGTYPEGMMNPLHIVGSVGDVLLALDGVSSPAGAVLVVASVLSVVVRYRGSSGVERQQLKWFAFVAAITGSAFLAAGVLGANTGGLVGDIDAVAWFVALVGLALLPVAIGIAVLRYRLYEIDRIVSRTISYAVVTAVLFAVFGATIVASQELLSALAGRNTIAVAASTLLVFALFQPLRRRVQGIVDRRFNRARYDSARTADAFEVRLRDQVDFGSLRADLETTVANAVGPRSVALWVRSQS